MVGKYREVHRTASLLRKLLRLTSQITTIGTCCE
jgi:hypothetical protein